MMECDGMGQQNDKKKPLKLIVLLLLVYLQFCQIFHKNMIKTFCEKLQQFLFEKIME